MYRGHGPFHPTTSARVFLQANDANVPDMCQHIPRNRAQGGNAQPLANELTQADELRGTLENDLLLGLGRKGREIKAEIYVLGLCLWSWAVRIIT